MEVLSEIELHEEKCFEDGCVLRAILNMRKRTNTPVTKEDFNQPFYSGFARHEQWSSCFSFFSFFDDLYQGDEEKELNLLIKKLGVRWDDFDFVEIDYPAKTKYVNINGIKTMSSLTDLFGIPKKDMRRHRQVEDYLDEFYLSDRYG